MRWPCAAILFLILTAATVLAQVGSIQGNVIDPLGSPLVNATVQAKNSASGALYQATTLTKGEYTVAGLPAGAYEVAVMVRGGRRYVQQNVAVEPGKPLRLDIRLKDDGQLGTIGDNYLSAFALDKRPVPAGPAPKALDGKPDLSGVWGPTTPVDNGNPEPLPWAAAEIKRRAENHGIDIPTGRCLPWGSVLDGPFPIKFIQSPSVIIILMEDVFSYRQIFMDGRSHPKDGDPTWMGHSIGRWDGDTLVIDTANFNDKSWSPAGRPHTEKFHLTERIRRPDLGHLEIETTIEDPGTYAKPWTTKRASTLAVGDEIGEYICAENNQDVPHLVGK